MRQLSFLSLNDHRMSAEGSEVLSLNNHRMSAEGSEVSSEVTELMRAMEHMDTMSGSIYGTVAKIVAQCRSHH